MLLSYVFSIYYLKKKKFHSGSCNWFQSIEKKKN